MLIGVSVCDLRAMKKQEANGDKVFVNDQHLLIY